MSIEALLEANTKALEANTAALLKAGGGSAAATTTTTGSADAGKGKGKGKTADAPKITRDQVNGALVKLKDKFGMDEAKAIIKAQGKVEKMGEIKDAQFQAVYEAAVARYEELETGDDEGGGDDEI
jgi:hypothetical protein